MHMALNLDVEVKDGTLVLTDHTGQTITFSKEQTVQKKVSMITLGELCGLPNVRSPLASASRHANPITIAAMLSSRGVPPTLCPNAGGPAAHRYAQRRWKRSSSARVLKPMGICMPSLTPSPRWIARSVPDSWGKSWPTTGYPKKTAAPSAPPRSTSRPRGNRNPRQRLSAASTPHHPA